MFDPAMERWPPTYDAESLANTIKDLAEHDRIVQNFFGELPAEKISPSQGDIIRLDAPVPILGEEGDPQLIEGVSHWIVLGNSCDITRDVREVAWSQIIPLLYLGNDREVTTEEMNALKGYHYSRQFYIPAWSAEYLGTHHAAEFLKPVTIHKTALFDSAQIEGTLSYYSWILFHSCLVRFFARDDGRFD